MMDIPRRDPNRSFYIQVVKMKKSKSKKQLLPSARNRIIMKLQNIAGLK